MSKKANSAQFPEITYNNSQTQRFVCSLGSSLIDELVARSRDLRASYGLPPALIIKISAYRVGANTKVLAEFEGGRLEKTLGSANSFRGRLKAKPEVIRAVSERKKTVRTVVTGEVTPKNITRWDNVPPKEQRQKRYFQMPQKINAPAVVAPPLLPPGYAVTGNKGAMGEALNGVEYQVLTEYVYRKIHSLSTPKVQDYDNDGHAGFGPKTPLNEWQRIQMDYCANMEEGLSDEHIDELNTMIIACANEHGISLESIGMKISGSRCPKEQIGVVKGYFKAVAQSLVKNDKKYREAGRYKDVLLTESAERVAS